MYEVITISYDGKLCNNIINNCERVENVLGFIVFISYDDVILFGVNSSKLLSYKRID